MVFSIKGDFAARILAKQNPVASLDIGYYQFTGFGHLSLANSQHQRLLRFLLCGIRNDDPAFGFVFFLDPLYQYAITQWPDFHVGQQLLLAVTCGVDVFRRRR